MLRIGICDDEKAILACLEQYVGEWVRVKGEIADIKSFSSAEQLWFSYDEAHFDILLLDIQMQGMDGITLSKKIRNEDERVQIVFITAVSDYISEGYEVFALHYLLKPVEKEKIFSVLDKAVKNLGILKQPLILQIEGETQVIPVRSIRLSCF